MTDWRDAYASLFKAGKTDAEIAELAGVTRAVVNKVRNGNWPWPHEPKHEGGQRVLAALSEVQAEDPINGQTD